jgi:intein-encoded DNA endonuclease-like protein
LRAAFDDEYSVYKEKKRNCGYIILSRYRHINELTRKQRVELEKLDPLMSTRRFPTGHISRAITIKRGSQLIKDKQLLKELRNAPKLLQDESSMLDEFGIDNRLFGRCLTKTHLGRYSLCFDLFVNRKSSLKKFYKEVGFSLSRKQAKLAQLVGG